ncbi:DNA cytosine methyltransferase [Listeria monocytogenes]|nr:DNA cytosine methyltransferase [Listeria monocytogenes]ECB9822583.1 DNA cytosine methyltransferase [Listeria monocytogenes]
MGIVAVDLFSGSGGTTQGLKKAGINIVAAVEIDEIAAKTYHYNNPEVILINEDIKSVSGESISQIVNRTKDFFMLVACPPCQGFSSIRHGGEGDIRNELVFEYNRLINELKPDFLLMENVSGMTSKRGSKIFSKFIESIHSDYEVEYQVLNAADFGVPQTRKRLVLHGVRKDIMNKMGLEKVSMPIKTHSQNEMYDLEPWVKAEVILGLPILEAGQTYDGPEKVYNHVANGLSETNLKRIEIIRNGGGSRDALPDNLVLNCHKGKSGHTDVYGVIDIEKPSITLTGGCMTFSKGRFGHPYQNRALSAREAARLQSFDDTYVFFGNRNQLARQIGNAVPVNLAKASGTYFVELTKGVHYYG